MSKRPARETNPDQRNRLTPDGDCNQCGQRHVTRYGTRACAGHVTKHRADAAGHRAPLPAPRPCLASPFNGQTVCGAHGGQARQNKIAGEQRMSEQRAIAVLRRFGEPVDTTPSDALLDAVKWTAGYVAWLRERVAGTSEQPIVDDAERATADDKALTQRSTQTGKQEASVWVDLLGTWHDRLVRICSEAIKAGIEERRVRIAEQQGALVADVIRKILDDLQLTAEQATRAGESVPRNLRLLAS